jgi:hypothetical protein
MARGWESKSVEEQVESNIEAHDGHRAANDSRAKDAQQLSREQEIKGLQLSRTRISNDLASATNPNHRKTLEAALAHLDKKIAELK